MWRNPIYPHHLLVEKSSYFPLPLAEKLILSLLPLAEKPILPPPPLAGEGQGEGQNPFMISNFISLDKLRGIVRNCRFNVWLLEGRERHSGEKLCIIYAGHRANKN